MKASLAAAKITEKAFTAQVLALAKLHGWHPYHVYDSRRSEPGFPDLVLVHRSRDVIFAELKAADGAVSPAQQMWLGLLEAAGARVYLWRPADWATILRVLGE